MPKSPKRLTKRQRQELVGKGPSGTPNTEGKHIHCLACGRHIDPTELSARPASATRLTCQHGSGFAACIGCVTEAQNRLDEHDRTGQPPRIESGGPLTAALSRRSSAWPPTRAASNWHVSVKTGQVVMRGSVSAPKVANAAA